LTSIFQQLLDSASHSIVCCTDDRTVHNACTLPASICAIVIYERQLNAIPPIGARQQLQLQQP
jgi:hypothetical protein